MGDEGRGLDIHLMLIGKALAVETRRHRLPESREALQIRLMLRLPQMPEWQLLRPQRFRADASGTDHGLRLE